MKAIILAAGYATRLYPLTKDKPKPLFEVKGKTILDMIIEKINLLRAIDEILIVTNNKFFENFLRWQRNLLGKVGKAKKKIKILNDCTKNEKERLGAIGDLAFVLKKEKIDDDFLVISGDNLFSFNLQGIYKDFSEKKEPVVGLYDVKSKEEARKFGIVSLDKNNRVMDFEEKPSMPKSTLASIGIYFYPKTIIKKIFQYLEEGNKKDAPGFFLEWLYKKQDVYGYIFSGRWFDIGSIESLKKAESYF